MSQTNNIMVLRVDTFIKFKLFGSKTSDISIINVKTISRLGVRLGGTTCADATHVNHELSEGTPSPST
jgi:hypothetical protein